LLFSSATYWSTKYGALAARNAATLDGVVRNACRLGTLVLVLASVAAGAELCVELLLKFAGHPIFHCLLQLLLQFLGLLLVQFPLFQCGFDLLLGLLYLDLVVVIVVGGGGSGRHPRKGGIPSNAALTDTPNSTTQTFALGRNLLSSVPRFVIRLGNAAPLSKAALGLDLVHAGLGVLVRVARLAQLPS